MPDWDTYAHTPAFRCSSSEVGERAYPHRIDWRRMPDALVLMLERGRYVIDFRGRRVTIGPGEAAVIAPEAEHRIHMPERDPVTVRYAHVNYTLGPGVDVFRAYAIPVKVAARDAVPIGECLLGLAAASAEPAGSIMRVARLQELGFRLLRRLIAGAQEIRPELLTPGSSRLGPVFAYIDSHLSEHLTREDLASHADLSPSRFHDVFRDAVGVAPMVFVQQRRMGLAKRLLIGSDMTVYQVALQAGYEDPYYFSRLFRKTQGVSPSAFRAAVRQSSV